MLPLRYLFKSLHVHTFICQLCNIQLYECTRQNNILKTNRNKPNPLSVSLLKDVKNGSCWSQPQLWSERMSCKEDTCRAVTNTATRLRDWSGPGKFPLWAKDKRGMFAYLCVSVNVYVPQTKWVYCFSFILLF